MEKKHFGLWVAFAFGSFLHQAYCQNPVKIMPLGNSITRGEQAEGTLLVSQMKGYRKELKQLLQGYGYVVDMVGSESSGEAYFTDTQHAGIGGSRDQYVARLLLDGYDERNGVQILVPPRPYLNDYNPDIILLHIGTNDITHESDPITIQQVSYILDLIDQYEISTGHEVIVFLARIINRKKPWIAGSGAATTTAFNDYIESMAQARISAGDKIVIVDMENDAGFLYDDSDMSDNLHPNDAGYMKMANLWYSSIIANYNTAPVLSAIPDQVLDEGSTSGILYLDNYVSDIQDPDENINWVADQPGTDHLNVVIDANRQATATPLDNDWYGTQTVVFTATDNGKNGKYIKSVSDTVVYTVNSVNDAPSFTSVPITEANTNEVYAYTFSAVDVDAGDILEYSLIENPAWLNFYSESKLLAGIPVQPGNYPVTLRVSDGQTHTDQPFTIHVAGLTGIQVPEPADRVEVYPNPASDRIGLSIQDHAEYLMFSLFDFSGKPVMTRDFFNLADMNIWMDCKTLLPGLYIYRIVVNDDSYYGKLIISK